MRCATTVGLMLYGVLGYGLTAGANPITGVPARDVAVTASDASAVASTATSGERDSDRTSQASTAPVSPGIALSDFGGSPLMLVAPPQVYSFGPHRKLRSSGGLFESYAGGGWPNGGGLLPSFVVAGLGAGAPSSLVGNLILTSGGTQMVSPESTSTSTSVPEPSALALMTAGLVIVVRRLRRARKIRT